MGNLEVEYLTTEHLAGFDRYKYNAIDTSPLSQYVMHPFWNNVVKLCPKWVAPNLLTFSGFLFTVANFAMFCYYDYYLYASSDTYPQYPPLSNFMWFVAAFTLFFSHTLDGIDGKQARRTGTSGPLGELFDHGLDSWTTVLIPLGLYSVFGRADYSIPAIQMFFCLWNVHLNFILTHWEKYNTGVLYLPWGYDFAMLTTFIFFFLTYVFGYQAMKVEFFGGRINGGMLFEFSLYAGSMLTAIPASIYHVYESYRDGTCKTHSFSESMRPLVSTLLLFLLTLMWVLWSPNDIINLDPRCFYYLVGTVFSNICSRLIVAQMSSTRPDLLNILLLPVAVVICVVLLVPMGSTIEHMWLYLLALISTIVHVHYGVCVVRQMCRHFRIKCFQIKSVD